MDYQERSERTIKICKKYQQRLLSFLYSYFQDADIAEEALQETFIEVYLHMDTLITHPNVGGWLVITAKNKGRNIIKKNIWHNKNLALDEAPEIASFIDFDKQIELIRLCNSIMSEDKFRILRLKYIDGYKINEIAQIYHITPSACKMRLKRTKELLKQYLDLL